MTTEKSSSSLTHRAYEQLKSDVLSCRIRPGDKLKIHELVARLEVSQGAIREALSRLSSEGLVVSEPQKGFHASPVSAAELLDLTRVRVEIETLCLRRSIELGDLDWEVNLMASFYGLSRTPERLESDHARMNDSWADAHLRFHEALISACDSPWLLRIRGQLFAQAERYRRLSVPLQESTRDTNAEHAAILEATVARQADRASELLSAHFRRTTAILLKALHLDAVETEASGQAPHGRAMPVIHAAVGSA